MRKNYDRSVILTVLIFALCTGCAGYTTGDETGVNVTGSAVSGTAVTGSAVSGAAVAETIKEAEPLKVSEKEERKKKHFFANETNVYRDLLNYDEVVKGIVQYTKDGQEQKTYKLKKCEGLLAVTEEGVYYAGGKDDSTPTELCRIPIEKKPDGTDLLKVEQTEVILTDKGGIQGDETGAYVDDDYIVYISYKDCVVKYDRKTGKRKELPTKGNINHIVSTGSEYLIIVSEYSGMLRLDLDNDQLERFSEKEVQDVYSARAVNGKYFFYSTSEDGEETIWVYNGKAKKNAKFILPKQMEEAVEHIPLPKNSWEIEQTEKTDLAFCYLCDLFCLNDRLFIQLQVEWEEEEKRWARYVILSLDLSDGNMAEPELCYEKKLSDLLGTESDRGLCVEYAEKTVEKIYSWNPSRVIDMVEGKTIFGLYKRGKEQQELGCYDWQDDKFYRLKKGEGAEYVSLYYDNKPSFLEDDWILGHYMNFMPDYFE